MSKTLREILLTPFEAISKVLFYYTKTTFISKMSEFWQQDKTLLTIGYYRTIIPKKVNEQIMSNIKSVPGLCLSRMDKIV